jgi:hypothetical protein
MRIQILAAVAALSILSACSRTKDGDLVVERPGDVKVTTTKDTLALPRVGTKTDTINTPTVGVQKETLIVNKPVVGTKKTEVKRPTVSRP